MHSAPTTEYWGAGSVVFQRPTRKTWAIVVGLSLGLVMLLVGSFLLAETLAEKRAQESMATTTSRALDVEPSSPSADGFATSASPPATTSLRGPSGGDSASTTAAPPATDDRCYSFVARLNRGPMQIFENNRDADASGTVRAMLCTNGTLRASMLLRDGKSEIIAGHIHAADGADGTDGADGNGPAVINMCGLNKRGAIQNGTPYRSVCPQWGETREVEGVLVAASNMDTSLAHRVEDIAERPHMYYFNVHTFGSWQQWAPNARGACRGPLEKGSR